jgi:hypothetical protein
MIDLLILAITLLGIDRLKECGQVLKARQGRKPLPPLAKAIRGAARALEGLAASTALR